MLTSSFVFRGSISVTVAMGRWAVTIATYQPADAAAADGGLELAVQLLDRAGGVEALSQ